jgi:hypothetical protein
MAIEALSTLACHHNQACTQPLLSASCAAQVLVVCSAFVNTDELTAVRQQARALGVGVQNPLLCQQMARAWWTVSGRHRHHHQEMHMGCVPRTWGVVPGFAVVYSILIGRGRCLASFIETPGCSKLAASPPHIKLCYFQKSGSM